MHVGRERCQCSGNDHAAIVHGPDRTVSAIINEFKLDRLVVCQGD